MIRISGLRRAEIVALARREPHGGMRFDPGNERERRYPIWPGQPFPDGRS
ncbi:hypothetical protein A7982_13866 [Minicystis rosea]|nr:hypothetical protein A7982_13866 [Minicystis rosea]